jgi:radical SAM protein with 4Fe4S-binding SPASM domain
MCTIIGSGKGVLPFGNVFQGFSWINNRKHCLNDSIKPRRKCQGCDYEKDCGGGCPATNFLTSENIFVPNNESCKLFFCHKRINTYMRKRHDKVFGTNWYFRVKELCEESGIRLL